MRKKMILALAVLGALAACAGVKGGYELPARHTAELAEGKRPICTDCHEARSERIPFERFNHTLFFADSHRQEARQHAQLCSLCHQPSFCSDCHATRVELKPSDKNPTDTYRRLPHRGDYRSRHMIDGRIDPTACFRCHGNPKTAITCKSCHG
jgi:hypothetical protein